MKGTRRNEKLYWDSRAARYPLPFDRSTSAKTRRIASLLTGLGIGFRGARLLDIGCGTGVYGLALAARASKVLGVDSSAAMLKIFRAVKKQKGIRNASCTLSRWEALAGARVKGRFDVALASMTAAVKTRADILKMEAAAPVRVFIGWAGMRRNALLEKVYAAHGVAYRAPEGAARTLRILRALKRRPAVIYLKDSWTREATVEETLGELEVSMKVNGAKLRREWTESLLRAKARGGKVRQRTLARKAVIAWGEGIGPAGRRDR